MGSALGYSKIATTGLTFAYDTGDTYNSYLGRPTSNILANAGMSTYNNVPGSVSSNLYSTSETYRGATVWRQDLTALDGSGASWLSNGNNPGIGVVTGGGGGNANQYSGHAIFFKPTVTMHSIPIYLAYSNIGGWQANTTPPEDMGDGWFRAYVLWYNTVTQSDGKYWAINPASTLVGQTVTIYWAGPFREDLNSTTISQFINGTRSSTGALNDISGKGSSLSLSNVSYTTPAINPQINFDGTNFIGGTNLGNVNDFTVEIVFKSNNVANYRNPIDCNWLIFNGGGSGYSNIGPRLEQNSVGNLSWIIGDAAGNYTGVNVVEGGLNGAVHHHTTITRTGSSFTAYYNGVQSGATTFNNWYGALNNINIGRGFSTSSERWFVGQIPVVKIYDKLLTQAEISQNFNHYQKRFNIPYGAMSATQLKAQGISTNGIYLLQPPGAPGPFEAYIDFTTPGGPWVHVGTIVDDGSTSNTSYHVWGSPLNPTQNTGIWQDNTTYGSFSLFNNFKSAGWSSIPFTQMLIKDQGITQRNLLYTNAGQVNAISLSSWFSSLSWAALGSDTSNAAYSAGRVTSLAITDFGVNDDVLQSSGKGRLLFKWGEADGAQDGNKDRVMIGWDRFNASDTVDAPTGLGCFTNRSGTIDYRNIVPGAYYGNTADFPPSSISGAPYRYTIWVKN